MYMLQNIRFTVETGKL